MILNDWGIKVRLITCWNPRVDVILEKVHQRISNILCTFEAKNVVLDDKKSWDGIL